MSKINLTKSEDRWDQVFAILNSIIFFFVRARAWAANAIFSALAWGFIIGIFIIVFSLSFRALLALIVVML